MVEWLADNQKLVKDIGSGVIALIAAYFAFFPLGRALKAAGNGKGKEAFKEFMYVMLVIAIAFVGIVGARWLVTKLLPQETIKYDTKNFTLDTRPHMDNTLELKDKTVKLPVA